MISVWAPDVESIELETLAGRVAMDAGDNGWWTASDLEPDTRYRFVIDGRELADPRSPRQPDGPQGWSQTVDHDVFEWTDQDWTAFPLASAVIYELHVGTFTPAATFDGVIERLDELVDLGLNAIEIMPVATFDGARGWGYDGVNLYAPHEAYGGPDGLKRLVDACHAHRIAVVIDAVYNHLGPVGNSLREFGPYFTDTYHSPWGDAVNLDGPGSDEVRRFVIDNALQWVVDYHADGLRLDAVHELHDESAVHILEELGEELHAAGRRLGRSVWVVAESDLNDPRIVRSSEAYGYGLDAAWSDDFHHAMHVTLTGEQEGYYGDFGGLGDVAAALRDVYVFGRRYAPSRHRTHGQSVGEMDRSRFVCFTQNHDQIGNRAIGERLGHLVPIERVEIGAAILLTSPFVPLLFQGEEWNASSPFQYFTDISDPEVGDAVRDGRRGEFGAFGCDPEQVPDPQDVETYRRSILNWDERDEPGHRRVLDWYRSLLALRSTHPSLRDGRILATTVDVDEALGWLRVERVELTVVVNLGDGQDIAVRDHAEILLTNDPDATLCGDSLHLAHDRVAILRHDTP